MSSTHGLKDLHDRLLADKPGDAQHDADTCPLCAVEEPSDSTPGGSMPETFTQEDLDAAVAAERDPLQKRLSELEAQVQETEVGRAVTEAVEAKNTEISKLQTQLDAAEAARTAAESKLAETEQYWTDAIAAHDAAVEFAARKDQRVAAAREAGVFTDDYISEHAERFAAMTDDDFTARLDEWRLIAARNGPRPVAPQPAQTALKASAAGESRPTSALGSLRELRERRIDPRTLGGVS